MQIKKKFNYKGYLFTITINLYSEQQNEIRHILTVECLYRVDYFVKYIFKDDEIEKGVVLAEKIAKTFIDDLLGETVIEERFKKLGFE